MKKNILAENMLRFGPKNLTESNRNSLKQLIEQAEAAGLPAYNSEYFKNNPTGTMKFEPNKGLVEVNGESYENLAYMDTGKSFYDFFISTLGRAAGNVEGKFNYSAEGGSIRLTPADDNQDTFCTENECIFNPKNGGDAVNEGFTVIKPWNEIDKVLKGDGFQYDGENLVHHSKVYVNFTKPNMQKGKTYGEFKVINNPTGSTPFVKTGEGKYKILTVKSFDPNSKIVTFENGVSIGPK